VKAKKKATSVPEINADAKSRKSNAIPLITISKLKDKKSKNKGSGSGSKVKVFR